MLPMHEATYRARAVSCGFGVAETGTTQIAIQCEIFEPDPNTGEDAPNGESITWIGHFTDKTTARTIESLQHFGWSGDDLSELEDLDAARAAELLPSIVELVCEPEEYEGQQRLRVRWVNKPGSGKFTFKAPLTGSALKAFAAQMKGQIRGARQGGSQPKPGSGGGRGPSRGGHPNAPWGNKDDDIPF